MKVDQYPKKLPMFKKAFISGASSGLGRALAFLLASKNISLIISGRNSETLQKIYNEVAGKVSVDIFIADLSQLNERRNLIEYLKKELPDLIINNAGFGIYGNPLNSTLEKQKEIIEVNAIAPFEITYELAKAHIQANNRATVLNVSSIAGEFPFPYSNLYSASKAFISHFSIAFNDELEKSDVKILTAAPGQIDTEFSIKASNKQKKDFKQASTMDVDFAAYQIWKQILKQKPFQIFDWRYRFANQLVKIFSYKLFKKILIKKIVERINE